MGRLARYRNGMAGPLPLTCRRGAKGGPQPQPSKVEGWWDGGSAAGMARPARSRGAHAHAVPSDRQGKGNRGRPR